jgi:hypothetical protein
MPAIMELMNCLRKTVNEVKSVHILTYQLQYLEFHINTQEEKISTPQALEQLYTMLKATPAMEQQKTCSHGCTGQWIGHNTWLLPPVHHRCTSYSDLLITGWLAVSISTAMQL